MEDQEGRQGQGDVPTNVLDINDSTSLESDLDPIDTPASPEPSTSGTEAEQFPANASGNGKQQQPSEHPLTKEDLSILYVETVQVLNGRRIDVPITTGRNGKPRPYYEWMGLPMNTFQDPETGEWIETLADTDQYGNRIPPRTKYIPELNKPGYHIDTWLQSLSEKARRGEMKGLQDKEDQIAFMEHCLWMIKQRAKANDIPKTTAKVIGVDEEGKNIFGPPRMEKLIGSDHSTFVQETSWDYMLQEAKGRRKHMRKYRDFGLYQAEALAGWVKFWGVQIVKERGAFVADEKAWLGYRRETDGEYEARTGKTKLKETVEEFEKRTKLRKLPLRDEKPFPWA